MNMETRSRGGFKDRSPQVSVDAERKIFRISFSTNQNLNYKRATLNSAGGYMSIVPDSVQMPQIGIDIFNFAGAVSYEDIDNGKIRHDLCSYYIQKCINDSLKKTDVKIKGIDVTPDIKYDMSKQGPFGLTSYLTRNGFKNLFIEVKTNISRDTTAADEYIDKYNKSFKDTNNMLVLITVMPGAVTLMGTSSEAINKIYESIKKQSWFFSLAFAIYAEMFGKMQIETKTSRFNDIEQAIHDSIVSCSEINLAADASNPFLVTSKTEKVKYAREGKEYIQNVFDQEYENQLKLIQDEELRARKKQEGHVMGSYAALSAHYENTCKREIDYKNLPPEELEYYRNTCKNMSNTYMNCVNAETMTAKTFMKKVRDTELAIVYSEEEASLIELWAGCTSVKADTDDYEPIRDDGVYDEIDENLTTHLASEGEFEASKQKMKHIINVDALDLRGLKSMGFESKDINSNEIRVSMVASRKENKSEEKPKIKYTYKERPIDEVRILAREKKQMKRVGLKLETTHENVTQYLEKNNLLDFFKLPKKLAENKSRVDVLLNTAETIINNEMIKGMDIDGVINWYDKTSMGNANLINAIIQYEVQHAGLVVNKPKHVTLHWIDTLGIMVIIKSSGPSKHLIYSLCIPKDNYVMGQSNLFNKYIEFGDFYITHFRTINDHKPKYEIGAYGAMLSNILNLFCTYNDGAMVVAGGNLNNALSIVSSSRASLHIEFRKMCNFYQLVTIEGKSQTAELAKPFRYVALKQLQEEMVSWKDFDLVHGDKFAMCARTSLQTYILHNIFIQIHKMRGVVIQVGEKATNFKGPDQYFAGDRISGMINYVTGGEIFNFSVLSALMNVIACVDKTRKEPVSAHVKAFCKITEFFSEKYNEASIKNNAEGIKGNVESPNMIGIYNSKFVESMSKFTASEKFGIHDNKEEKKEDKARLTYSFIKGLASKSINDFATGKSTLVIDSDAYTKPLHRGEACAKESSKLFLSLDEEKEYFGANPFVNLKKIIQRESAITGRPGFQISIHPKDEFGVREIGTFTAAGRICTYVTESLSAHLSSYFEFDAVTNTKAKTESQVNFYRFFDGLISDLKSDNYITFYQIISCISDLSKYGPGTSLSMLFDNIKYFIPMEYWDYVKLVLNKLVLKDVLINQIVADTLLKPGVELNIAGFDELKRNLIKDGVMERQYVNVFLGFLQGLCQNMANLVHCTYAYSMRKCMHEKIVESMHTQLSNMFPDALVGDIMVKAAFGGTVGADDSCEFGGLVIGFSKLFFQTHFLNNGTTNLKLKDDVTTLIKENLLASANTYDNLYRMLGWKKSYEKISKNFHHLSEFYSIFFYKDSVIMQPEKFGVVCHLLQGVKSFTERFDAFYSSISQYHINGADISTCAVTNRMQGFLHYLSIGCYTSKCEEFLKLLNEVRIPDLGYFTPSCHGAPMMGLEYARYKLANEGGFRTRMLVLSSMFLTNFTATGLSLQISIAQQNFEKSQKIIEKMKITDEERHNIKLKPDMLAKFFTRDINLEIFRIYNVLKVTSSSFMSAQVNQNSLANYRLAMVSAGKSAVHTNTFRERKFLDENMKLDYLVSEKTKKAIISRLENKFFDKGEMFEISQSSFSFFYGEHLERKLTSFYNNSKFSIMFIMEVIMWYCTMIDKVRTTWGQNIDKILNLMDKLRSSITPSSSDLILKNMDSYVKELIKIKDLLDTAQENGGITKDHQQLLIDVTELIELLKFRTIMCTTIRNILKVGIKDFMVSHKTIVNPIKMLGQDPFSILLYKNVDKNMHDLGSIYYEIDEYTRKSFKGLERCNIETKKTYSVLRGIGDSSNISLQTVIEQLWFPEQVAKLMREERYEKVLYDRIDLINNLNLHRVIHPWLRETIEDTMKQPLFDNEMELLQLISLTVPRVKEFVANLHSKLGSRPFMTLETLLEKNVKYNTFTGYRCTFDKFGMEIDLPIAIEAALETKLQILRDAYCGLSRLVRTGSLNDNNITILLDNINAYLNLKDEDFRLIYNYFTNARRFGTNYIKYADLLLILLIRKNPGELGINMFLMMIQKNSIWPRPQKLIEEVQTDIKDGVTVTMTTRKWVGPGILIQRHHNLYIRYYINDDVLEGVHVDNLNTHNCRLLSKIIDKTCIRIGVRRSLVNPGDNFLIYGSRNNTVNSSYTLISDMISKSKSGLPIMSTASTVFDIYVKQMNTGDPKTRRVSINVNEAKTKIVVTPLSEDKEFSSISCRLCQEEVVNRSISNNFLINTFTPNKGKNEPLAFMIMIAGQKPFDDAAYVNLARLKTVGQVGGGLIRNLSNFIISNTKHNFRDLLILNKFIMEIRVLICDSNPTLMDGVEKEINNLKKICYDNNLFANINPSILKTVNVQNCYKSASRINLIRSGYKREHLSKYDNIASNYYNDLISYDPKIITKPEKVRLDYEKEPSEESINTFIGAFNETIATPSSVTIRKNKNNVSDNDFWNHKFAYIKQRIESDAGRLYKGNLLHEIMSHEGNPEPYLKGIKELIMADYSFIEYKNDYVNLVTQIAEHLNQIKGQVDALDIANNPNKEEGIDYNDYLIRDDSDEPSDVDSFEDEEASYEFYDSENYDVVSWDSNSEDESGL